MNACVCLFIIPSTLPRYKGTTTNLVLNTQKYPYLNQATQKITSSHPKKYFPNFPTLKKFRNRKFGTTVLFRNSPEIVSIELEENIGSTDEFVLPIVAKM